VADLRVLKPGLSTTIQDLGRQRCLQMGIPTGGAADQYSHRLANAIAGNDASAPTLEMMLLGASFEVLHVCEVAVAGADMGFQVSGEAAEMGRAISVAKGDVLTFSKARRGCFGYLAIRGGFDGTVVLGSRSTYVAGRLGGHFGRALRTDDVLDALDDGAGSGLVAGEELLAWPLQHDSLRFVRGPQPEYFTAAAYRAFTGDPHTVSPRSNRVAHRLTGPALELQPVPRTSDTGSGPSDIIEDGNAIGAIQIAGGVEPICMGRDCPTTGAYAKIGCIVMPDVSRLAQMQPGDSFRFQEVSVGEAYEISREVSRMVASFAP
jgi:antagonist of KipI